MIAWIAWGATGVLAVFTAGWCCGYNRALTRLRAVLDEEVARG